MTDKKELGDNKLIDENAINRYNNNLLKMDKM